MFWLLTAIKNRFGMKCILVFDSVIFELFEKSPSVYAGKYKAAFRKLKHLPNIKLGFCLVLFCFLKLSLCDLLCDAFLQKIQETLVPRASSQVFGSSVVGAAQIICESRQSR